MDEKQKVIVKWLENIVQNKKWSSYFASYGYSKISVYGAGDLGKLLIWELKESDITIDCVIDRRAKEIGAFEGCLVMTLEDFFKSDSDSDAIIVTALSAYEEVLKIAAKKRIDLPVLFLRDMVYEL